MGIEAGHLRRRAHSMRLIVLMVGYSFGCSALRAQSYESPRHDLPPAVQQHVDLAYFAWNGAVSQGHLAAMLYLLPQDRPAGQGRMPKRPILPATKVFDQLYYLGTDIVSAWALVTSDGIILIDTLENAEEAKTNIEEGLRSVKLDPAQIKYIIVTHGHDDHYGGAKYLQEKYHPRVLMSAADWQLAEETAGEHPDAGLPKRDKVVSDGETLTLGNTQVKMYVTPGHTPGVLSTIFTVTDHGRPHVVSFFGGYGVQFIDKDPRKGGFALMRDSLLRFGKLSLDAGADVILADHPFNDGSYEKVEAERAGKAGDHNPWVEGKETVQLFYLATIEAVTADETYLMLQQQGKGQ